MDSELAIFGVVDHPIAGPLNNAFYDKSAPFLTQSLAPFFIVSRIDGPSYEIAQRLIDDALAVEKTGLLGKVYIDLAQKNDPGYKEGEDWLLGSAKTFGASGFPLIIDSRPDRFLLNFPMTEAAVYLGWYVQVPDGPFLNPKFKFKRGAIACHLHSWSATTIRVTNDGWAGLLLSQGACGVFGNVYEPFLGLTVHFDKLSDRLLRGFCLAEAASMATPGCSWMNVVIGDPLYRPFAADLDAGTSDPEIAWCGKRCGTRPRHPGEIPLCLVSWKKPPQPNKVGSSTNRSPRSPWGTTPTEHDRIFKYLTAASEHYAGAADRIRILLQRTEFMAGISQKDKAIKLLKAGLTEYSKEPEVKAIEARLAEWQPKDP